MFCIYPQEWSLPPNAGSILIAPLKTPKTNPDEPCANLRRIALGNNPHLTSSGMDIPDYVIESIARSLLPVIQAYYDSEEGRKMFEEWEHVQDTTEEDLNHD